MNQKDKLDSNQVHGQQIRTPKHLNANLYPQSHKRISQNPFEQLIKHTKQLSAKRLIPTPEGPVKEDQNKLNLPKSPSHNIDSNNIEKKVDVNSNPKKPRFSHNYYTQAVQIQQNMSKIILNKVDSKLNKNALNNKKIEINNDLDQVAVYIEKYYNNIEPLTPVQRKKIHFQSENTVQQYKSNSVIQTNTEYQNHQEVKQTFIINTALEKKKHKLFQYSFVKQKSSFSPEAPLESGQKILIIQQLLVSPTTVIQQQLVIEAKPEILQQKILNIEQQIQLQYKLQWQACLKYTNDKFKLNDSIRQNIGFIEETQIEPNENQNMTSIQKTIQSFNPTDILQYTPVELKALPKKVKREHAKIEKLQARERKIDYREFLINYEKDKDISWDDELDKLINSPINRQYFIGGAKDTFMDQLKVEDQNFDPSTPMTKFYKI